MFRNKNIKKGLVFGMFLLFLIASVYPILGKTNKGNENDVLINYNICKKESLLNYNIAYIKGGFEIDCWLYTIALNNPANPTCHCQDFPGSDSGGTCTKEGVIITSEYGTGNIWKLDPITCESISIGGGGVSLNGLAYDPSKDEIFACTNNNLYKIDGETGEQEYVGRFGSTVIDMLGIACDAEGELYGWDFGGNLWSINKKTGSATLVGPLGIDLSYASDGDFHKSDDILYIATYTSNYESYLYECDEDTGNCNLVGQFKDNVQVTFFAIPWNYYPIADFDWTPELPDPGETILFDGSSSYDPDGNIILYEWDWDNDGVYDESNSIPTTTHVFEDAGLYPITLNVKDEYSANDTKMHIVKVGNGVPEKPVIDGPTRGGIYVYFNYSITPIDPDGEMVYVRWDWGNGDTYPWAGPFASGEEITESYVWSERGKYIVKAQVKDEYDAESEWGELQVNIPRNKMQQNLFLLRLLERFPFIKQIIIFFGGYN